MTNFVQAQAQSNALKKLRQNLAYIDVLLEQAKKDAAELGFKRDVTSLLVSARKDTKAALKVVRGGLNG